MNPKLNPLTAALVDYRNEGKPVSDFLVCFLVNDLVGALEHSQGLEFDIHDFRCLAEFIEINLPPQSHGSKEAVMYWYRENNPFFAKSGSKIESDKEETTKTS